MIDDDAELGARLRAHLRRASDAPGLEYAAPPRRVKGGFETDIFRFELREAPQRFAGPLILRRLRLTASPRQAQYEEAVQNALVAQSYPAPEVVLIETDPDVLDGVFVLMREMPGRVLAQGMDAAVSGGTGNVVRLLASAPKTMMQIGALWTDAHLQLHALPTGPIQDAIATRGLTASTFASRLVALEVDAQRTGLQRLLPVLHWLQRHRPDDRALALCHGDFHPLNILVRDGQVTAVLDWGSATIAPPAFDVGSTIANLLTVPVGGPPLMRPAVKGLIRFVLRRYVRGYMRRSPLRLDSVRYFQVYRCAAQLAAAARSEGTAGGAHHLPAARKALATMIRRITGLAVGG